MPAFESSVEIKGDRDQIFAMTQDYDHRLDWDPFLKEARILDGTEVAIGRRVWCVARAGLGMETEYFSFQPPNIAAVKMTIGPWFLEQFAGTWRFDCIEANRTRATFRYSLKGRPRVITR